MTYFWVILAGLSCTAASKGITKDEVEKKFDALIDRIEVLENKVREQDRVIQSQQNHIANMKETINVKAEELKTERDNVVKLRVKTILLRSDVKRLDRRVEMFESRTIRTSDTSKDAKQTEFDGNSTEPKEGQTTMKTSPESVDDKYQNGDSDAEKYRLGNKAVIRKETATRRKDVRRLLAPVQTTQVAFSAYLDKTVPHLGINHVIPFDKVLLNEGNAFNTHTGMFHCPQSGVYLFTFTIESNSLGVIAAKLIVDGANQVNAATGGSVHGVYTTGGATAIVRVLSGQSVWVATYRISDVTLFNEDVMHYTTFSGVLLF